MQVTLFQRDIEWAQPAINRQRTEQALLEAPKSDLYVLPEMWSTGFVTSPQDYDTADRDIDNASSEAASSPIEGENGPTLQWMQQMAVRLDAAVAGSMATKAADGTYRNRFYFVTPDGVSYYDKHHLFTYGGEHKRYTPGQERVIVEWRGVRFLMQVCYDLRFAIFSRNTSETPYDCALYVASWPTPRVEAWRTLLLARAIENQCYVCGVNRVGTDPACQYCGGTAFIDPYGIRQAEVPMNEEGMLTCTIDMDALNAFRKKFPVLNDRD